MTQITWTINLGVFLNFKFYLFLNSTPYIQSIWVSKLSERRHFMRSKIQGTWSLRPGFGPKKNLDPNFEFRPSSLCLLDSPSLLLELEWVVHIPYSSGVPIFIFGSGTYTHSCISPTSTGCIMTQSLKIMRCHHLSYNWIGKSLKGTPC